MITLLNSETFWLGATALVTWTANSLLTVRVAKMPATSPWRRAIRVLHGLLEAIDLKDVP